MTIAEKEVTLMPLLPLRDVVVYPHMVIPLFVGRPKSINALEKAMEDKRQIFLVTQKSKDTDEPDADDIYEVGTVSTVLQLLKLPDGTVKVLVEGSYRAKLDSYENKDDIYLANISPVVIDNNLTRSDALVSSMVTQFEQYVQLNKKVPTEVLASASNIDDVDRLSDTIAAHLLIKLDQKQKVLEIFDLPHRIEHLITLMESEVDLFQVEKRIRGRVKKQMEKSQREYYLNEQMKAIQKELGDIGESGNDAENIKLKVEDAGMTKEAKEKALLELNKLKMMSPMSAEATVVRGYIDWLLSIPWKKRSKVRQDLARAEVILDQDHYGLVEVKDRILEYLAVQKRMKKLKGPVLCLVGPPGVGKTSLGQSIARATNRKFIRMALGGVRDEAEIRGHRRTYIGSMPGKIIQKMSKIGVKNPLFLLDEIDKMGMDMRGDPASALLEVLDPEQNNTFNDHYLEVDYDLSDVLFICTSNSMNIPAPLLDRMEIIRIPGYTEDEKLNISKRYLIPKQIKTNGLKKGELSLKDEVVLDLIRYHTREAGVRGLEREIAKISRKVVKNNVLKKDSSKTIIDSDVLEEYAGVRKFNYGRAEEKNQIGQVTGLAWTQVGGELLTIEAAAVDGKGRYTKTGSLGDVMQESITAALTVVRSRAPALGIAADFHEKYDIHIHVPEGATPKDGPSAGVGMCTALVSVLSNVPVRADVAMTGEITLRGQVLKIGGLKEKLLAAHRGGVKTIIIPKENEADLREIPANIVQDLEIKPVKWIDDVLEIALEFQLNPVVESKNSELLTKSTDKKETTEKPSKPTVSTH